MSDVIAKASDLSGGKNEAVSTDVMTLYSMVNRQARGGFRLNHNGPAYGYDHVYRQLEKVSGGGGLAWGHWRNNNITIWLNEQEIPANTNTTPTARAQVPYTYAKRALHELVHVAGTTGLYSHDLMDKAARDIDSNPTAEFDTILKKHCFPSEMR
jgi:hypothetical protein